MSYAHSLAAGASAGFAVDLLFFPLDTLKTRLQAKEGFIKAGGFKGIYKGLGSVVVGSAPGASFFFVSYEYLKRTLPNLAPALRNEQSAPIAHMLAASGGEAAACIVRVPTEVVKQRQQTSAYGAGTSSWTAVTRVVAESGIKGLYRGYFTTLAREIPFCCIQFPLYERFKLLVARQRDPSSLNAKSLPAWPHAALCGSLAGAIASAITTPLDVAKTRIMLTRDSSSSTGYSGTWQTLAKVRREEGTSALFKGIGPRVLWISLGGSVFLGCYEGVVQLLEPKPGRPVVPS